jgi:hypothetical protein
MLMKVREGNAITDVLVTAHGDPVTYWQTSNAADDIIAAIEKSDEEWTYVKRWIPGRRLYGIHVFDGEGLALGWL